MTTPALNEKILKEALTKANLWSVDQALYFPLITKSGVNQQGKKVHYYFNYSANPNTVKYPYKGGKNLLSNTSVTQNSTLSLGSWGMEIIEED
jgi:beta-galactosidase